MNNDKKNNNVDDIFARQIAALDLDDELDATKIDLDMMGTFEDDFEEESLPIDEIPLMLANVYNETTDPNEMSGIIIQGINSVIHAIESDQIDHKSIDRNEKLLLITENHNL